MGSAGEHSHQARVHQMIELYKILSRNVSGMGRNSFLVMCLTLVSGCDSFQNDPSSSASRVESAAATELNQAADRYLASSRPGTASYKLGPQDVLEISVFNAPELSKTVQVSDEGGAINLPLVGRVSAAGRSPSTVERDLEGRLNAKYLKNAQVTVFVKEFNSQRITVDGAVRKPGVFSVRGRVTLTQAIGYAGGADRDYSSNDVIVFRVAGGTRTVVRYDLELIQTGQAGDPQLFAGDVIVVPDSQAKTYFQYAAKLLPLATSVALVGARFAR